MNELKIALLETIETYTFLAIGLLFTIYVFEPTYESFGMEFIGNVWVNWFGVTYLLFACYMLIIAFVKNHP